MGNSRFAVAVHLLTLLEEGGGQAVTSQRLAASVNTNPSLVRKILGQLAKAGLTRAQLGSGGGALLARPAGEITLVDLLRAVGEGRLFDLPREKPNPDCLVGRNIQAALEAHFAAATRAMEEELGRTTVAGLLREVRAEESRRPRRRRR